MKLRQLLVICLLLTGLLLAGCDMQPILNQVLPVAPSGLTAQTQSQTSIQLAWQDNSTNETGFKIERSTSETSGFAQIAATMANQATYADTDLNSNTTYYYRVKASNSLGDSTYSNITQATTNSDTTVTIPANPDNLVALAQSQSEIKLTWSDLSNNETGFRVYRSTISTGGFVQIQQLASNNTTYTDTSLNASTTYYYQIKAYNEAGESEASNTAQAITLNPPANSPVAPGNLVALTQSQSEIKLTWSDLSNNETGFRVYRSTISTGGFVQIQQLASNITTYTDTDLNASTTYYYQIKAYNEVGESAASNTAQAVTLNPPANPPATPGNLLGTVVSQSEIRLSWTDLSNNENGFRVYRSTTATGNYTQVQQLGSNVTSFTDSGLNAGTSYFYKVSSFNNDGESAPTNWIEAKTMAAPVTPAAPGNLVAQVISTTEIELTWSDLSNNESGFRVYRSPVSTGGFERVGEVVTNVTRYTDTGLSSNTQYYYLVVAYNNAGESSFSNMAEVTTISNSAVFRIYNNTKYALISLQIDTGSGPVEMINNLNSIVPAGMYKDIEFDITGGDSAVISYNMEVGFYDQYNGKNPRFTFWGDSTLVQGQQTDVCIEISLAQVLSNFKTYSDWEGMYWSNGLPGYKTFRFYENGRWELYNNGYLADSGNQVILVRWDEYSDFIYFKFTETSEVIEYYYPYFKFYYNNGPQDWPVIEYGLKVY